MIGSKVRLAFVKNELYFLCPWPWSNFYQMCDVPCVQLDEINLKNGHNFSITFDTMIVWMLMLLIKNAHPL
jgi:hypothetical protein